MNASMQSSGKKRGPVRVSIKTSGGDVIVFSPVCPSTSFTSTSRQYLKPDSISKSIIVEPVFSTELSQERVRDPEGCREKQAKLEKNLKELKQQVDLLDKSSHRKGKTKCGNSEEEIMELYGQLTRMKGELANLTRAFYGDVRKEVDPEENLVNKLQQRIVKLKTYGWRE